MAALDERFESAKKLCSQFLTGNWTLTDSIGAKVLTGGYCNVLILCELPEHLCTQATVPWKVLVRFITGVNTYSTIGEAAEALLFRTLAEAGLGPKLYGVFEGGRLEEFVDGRMFTFQDGGNRGSMRAAARQLARCHSLELEIRKSPDISEAKYYESSVSKFPKEYFERTFLDKMDKLEIATQDKMRLLMTVDYDARFKWLLANLKSTKSRVVVCHLDHYGNNILIKNDRTVIESEFDLSLVDVESFSMFYRAADIGVFLHELSYNFDGHFESPYNGPIDEGTQRAFIEDYIELWKELNPDKFDAALDNVDHIMMEQKAGAMLFSIIVFFFFVTSFDSPEAVPANILNLLILRHEKDGEVYKELEQFFGRPCPK
ncbi:Choline/ethanolamine kinase [Halotydeus destructor]|nr:Choline/ethanolamine kinase [Halotydeus destructor]